MPVTTHYVDQGQGAFKHAHGMLTSTDLLVTALIQSQDVENTRKLKYIFYDFIDITATHVVGNDILHKLVELNRKTAAYAPGITTAIVAPDDLLFALARNWYELTADFGWKSQVFHQRPEALAWLRGQMKLKNVECLFLEHFPGQEA